MRLYEVASRVSPVVMSAVPFFEASLAAGFVVPALLYRLLILIGCEPWEFKVMKTVYAIVEPTYLLL